MILFIVLFKCVFRVMRKPDGTVYLCKIEFFFLMVPLTWTRSPVFDSPKHLQIITDAPPCLTVRNIHSPFCLSSGYFPTFSNLTSSVHNTCCHAFHVLFKKILSVTFFLLLHIQLQWCFDVYATLEPRWSKSFFTVESNIRGTEFTCQF